MRKNINIVIIIILSSFIISCASIGDASTVANTIVYTSEMIFDLSNIARGPSITVELYREFSSEMKFFVAGTSEHRIRNTIRDNLRLRGFGAELLRGAHTIALQTPPGIYTENDFIIEFDYLEKEWQYPVTNRKYVTTTMEINIYHIQTAMLVATANYIHTRSEASQPPRQIASALLKEIFEKEEILEQTEKTLPPEKKTQMGFWDNFFALLVIVVIVLALH
jgi:hypothetical protein